MDDQLLGKAQGPKGQPGQQNATAAQPGGKMLPELDEGDENVEEKERVEAMVRAVEELPDESADAVTSILKNWLRD